MVSKIKAKITKIAIILFMLAVDAPFRICLMLAGFGYTFMGFFLSLSVLAFYLIHLVAPEAHEPGVEPLPFMMVLSMFITGIAGCRVAYRAQPYRDDPPYLDREIINKRTNLIPICVLGIACLFYVHWPPIETFYEEYTNLIGPEKIYIFVPTYGFTAGFVYAIAERIILKIVVRTLGHTMEAPGDEISTSTKEKL